MKPLSPYLAVSEGFSGVIWHAYLASSEGFRLIWREPKAVAAWVALWFGAFSAAAWVVAGSLRGIAAAMARGSDPAGIAQKFGPFGALLVLMFLVVWLVTAVAAFRAVLRPDDRRWFYLRLGADEARLGALTLVASLAAVALGGAPAYLLFVLASPIMQAVPALTRDIATGGALVTVWVDVWLVVRLSLIAVETFSERRFHLTSYWPVTGGRFWYLLASYFLIFLTVLGVTMVSFAAAQVLSEIAINWVGNGDLFRRGSVLAIAGVLALLTAVVSTLTWTVICACQAYAFRAIVGEGRDGVAPA